jgi:hypothetical protein
MRGSAFFEDVRQIDMMIGEHLGKIRLSRHRCGQETIDAAPRVGARAS